jgi:type I restriction enzyme S subunit
MAEPMAVSQHFIAWVCDNSKKMNSWFLYNWLQTHKREFERQAVGSTIKTIGLPYFKKLKILAPSYQEQNKIAKILSVWDNAVLTAESLIKNSKQKKKGLSQQLLLGKKRLLNDEGIRFNKKWVPKYLSDIAKVKKGKALSSKNLEVGSFPVIAGGKSSPYNHNKYTHENVITISASGAYAGYVAYHEQKIWASDCSVVEVRCDTNLHFIYQYLLLNQIRIYSLQSGGAQPHIYPKDIDALKIDVPELVEQQKIAAVLTNADKEIELLEQQLSDLKQEKKSLMQQLLTGKRRVKIEGEAA